MRQLRTSFTSSGQLLHCAHKRIVNIMKVYIERNNMQVELIRFRKSPLFTFTFAKRGIQCDRRVYVLEMCYNISLFDSKHFNYP